MDEGADASSSPYARRVGARLRSIRRQRGLSLQDVEGQSGGEFRASVVGAYERGERAISVPRLERLARLYGVPVDQLLPREGAAPEPAVAGEGVRAVRSDPAAAWDVPEKVTIDLARVEGADAPEAETLRRYVSAIQLQRQDFNGRVLTLRRDDIRALAGVLGTPTRHLVRRLDDLHLRHPG